MAYPYATMFATEDRLWWYRGLRLYLEQAFARAGVTPASMVLDAGCGTGGNLALLSRRCPSSIGCDFAVDALSFCRSRGLKRIVAGDVNDLPFQSGAFDCVLSSDVFECREVDERRAIAELARVTRPGGYVILSMAAYEFLMSEHDRAFHTNRRFTKRRVRETLSTRGLEIVQMRYLFGSFFLPIAAYRLLKRLMATPASETAPQTDLFLPPAVVNAAMLGVVRLEAALSRFVPVPFGTTLLVEMRRV